MSSLAGLLNSSAVLLSMFDPDAGASGEWVVIGGQLTGGLASTVAPLDMTNKDSGGVQEFLEGEGRQDFNQALTLIFNSSDSYAALQAAHRTKAVRRFQWARGALDIEPGPDLFEGIVSTFSDSAANETILTAAVTIQSVNDTQSVGVLFDDAIDVNLDDAIDVALDAAVARA